MLIPKSLTLANIGRFVEPQTVDFTKLGSLVQVEGINNNTNGSSGAAKSTLFKSFNWLLGLDGPSTTILQSRLTKEHIEVSGIFDYDGQPLKISRGRKLSIELNGVLTTGSSKLTEELLDSIIGMDRDLFSKILHKKQGSGGFFLELGPSKTYEFLTKCLSLDKEQAKITTLDLRLDTLAKKEASLKSDIESNKSGLEATQNAIFSLGSAPSGPNPDSLALLKQAHVQATDTHRLVVESLKVQMEELEKSRPQVTVTPYDRSKIVQLELEIDQVKTHVAQLEKAEHDRQSEVKSKISELQILASKLGQSEITRQNDIKTQISSLRVEIAKLQGLEQSRQSNAKSFVSALQIELIKAQALVAQGVKAKEEATTLAKELQKVKTALCPTCERGDWVNDACKAKEAEILGKLLEYKKTIIAGTEASGKITTINEQLEFYKEGAKPRHPTDQIDLTKKIAELEEDANPRVIPEVSELSYQVEHLKSELSPKIDPKVVDLGHTLSATTAVLGHERAFERDHQFKESAKSQLILANYVQKQTEMRQEHQFAVKFAQDAEQKALHSLREVEYTFKSFKEAKAKFDESLSKLNKQASSYQYEIQLLTTDLQLAQEELELAFLSKEAIKSYLSCSFESALEGIGDEATRRIRRLPNMATGTVQFDGLKENKDGKVKEEVNAVLSMDGEIGIPVKSLSGGERSSVDLAVDLSVVSFIEETTGKGINLMELDEAFTGLDSVNIMEVLETLKDSNSNKQILLIDHNPLVAQAIDCKLTVIRDGLTSRIVQ